MDDSWIEKEQEQLDEVLDVIGLDGADDASALTRAKAKFLQLIEIRRLSERLASRLSNDLQEHFDIDLLPENAEDPVVDVGLSTMFELLDHADKVVDFGPADDEYSEYFDKEVALEFQKNATKKLAAIKAKA
jgi:hypothetical protein